MRFIEELFHAYIENTDQLPPDYQKQLEDEAKHRVICDYIAGMTDRFAIQEHQSLFDPAVRG